MGIREKKNEGKKSREGVEITSGTCGVGQSSFLGLFK